MVSGTRLTSARTGTAERALVLVEGISDRAAVEAVARRLGRDLEAEGVSVVPMGGAHSIGRVLGELAARGGGVRLAGLYDVGEERQFQSALERAGFGSDLTRADLESLGFFVCVRDLEDELVRALGVRAIEELFAANGDLHSFRTLQKQVEWRGRPPEDQIHRFLGSGGRRKSRYPPLFVDALEPDRIPRPLRRVVEHVA